VDNLLEYAGGTIPTNRWSATGVPDLSFVETDSGRFGTVTFTRYLPARDLEFVAEATSTLSTGWQWLSQLSESETISDSIERVTLRDEVPATNVLHRFYRLRANMR